MSEEKVRELIELAMSPPEYASRWTLRAKKVGIADPNFETFMLIDPAEFGGSGFRPVSDSLCVEPR